MNTSTFINTVITKANSDNLDYILGGYPAQVQTPAQVANYIPWIVCFNNQEAAAYWNALQDSTKASLVNLIHEGITQISIVQTEVVTL